MGNKQSSSNAGTSSPGAKAHGYYDFEDDLGSITSVTDATCDGWSASSCPYRHSISSSSRSSVRSSATPSVVETSKRATGARVVAEYPSLSKVLFQTGLICVLHFFATRFMLSRIDFAWIQESTTASFNALVAILVSCVDTIKPVLANADIKSILTNPSGWWEGGEMLWDGASASLGTSVACVLAVLAGRSLLKEKNSRKSSIIVLVPTLFSSLVYVAMRVDPSTWWDSNQVNWDVHLQVVSSVRLLTAGFMGLDLLYGREKRQGSPALLAPALIYTSLHIILSIHAQAIEILDFDLLSTFGSKKIVLKSFSKSEMVAVLLTHIQALDMLLAYAMMKDFYSRITSRRQPFRLLMIAVVALAVWHGVAALPVYFFLRFTFFAGMPIPRGPAASSNRTSKMREGDYMYDPIPDGVGPLKSWALRVPFPLSIPVYYFFLAIGICRFFVVVISYFFYVYGICMPVSAVFFSLRRTWKCARGEPVQGHVFAPFETVNGQRHPFKANLVITGHLRLICFKYQKSAVFNCLVGWWLRLVIEAFLFFEFFIPFMLDFNPYSLFLMSEFGPVWPHGQGLGFGSYNDVKSLIQSPRQRKGYLAAAMSCSSSQKHWSKNNLITLPQSESEWTLVSEGRELVRCFLQDVSEKLRDPHVRKRLDAILPYNNQDGTIPDTNTLVMSFGLTFFHLLTDGDYTEEERKAYIAIVTKGGFSFMSDHINSIFFSGALERRTIENYDKIRRGFLRYPEAEGLQRALAKVEENKWDAWDAPGLLRFLVYKFVIAGGAAPALLTNAIVNHLFHNKEFRAKYKAADSAQRRLYLLEICRTERSVPYSSFIAHDFNCDGRDYVEIFGEKLPVPDGTPLHGDINSANKDPSVFGDDAHLVNFDRDPATLMKNLTFNGCQQEIHEAMSGENPNSDFPIRRCPGYSYALDIIEFLADRFMPDDDIPGAQISTEQMQQIQNRESMFVKYILRRGRSIYAQNNKYFPHPSCVKHPMDTAGCELGSRRISAAGRRTIPVVDEDQLDWSSIKDEMTSKALGIFPIQDIDGEWESVNEAIGWRAKWFSSNFPPVQIDYTDCKTMSKMVTEMAFAGLCCLHTETVESLPCHSLARRKYLDEKAVYVNDNTALGDYRVRRGFQRYGAAAYFDADYNLIGIYTCCDAMYHTRPSDDACGMNVDRWIHAMWAWRVSAMAYVTVSDHVVNVHMIAANALVKSSRKSLSISHPLRALMQMFTFRTVGINRKAFQTLIMRKGVVNRNWAFEEDDLQQMLFSTKNNFKKNFRDYIPTDMRRVKDYPPNHDLVKFCDIVTSFVRDFLCEVYKSSSCEESALRLQRHMDNDTELQAFLGDLAGELGLSQSNELTKFDDIVDVLTSLICNVTAMHELVGQISDYFADPRLCGTTIRRGKEIDSIQTYQLNCTLVASTGLRMPPLLGNWEHLLSRHPCGDDTIRVMRKFQSDLRLLAQEIDALNDQGKPGHRRFRMTTLDPSNMECSVAV